MINLRIMQKYSLDHIGIASFSDLPDIFGTFLRSGDDGKIRSQFTLLPDGNQIETISPIGDSEGDLSQFMEDSDHKLHHIAFAVENLETLDLPEKYYASNIQEGIKKKMRSRWLRKECTLGVLIELVDYQ